MLSCRSDLRLVHADVVDLVFILYTTTVLLPINQVGVLMIRNIIERQQFIVPKS